MADKKSQTEKFVLNYLQKLGLRPSKSPDQFWRELYTRHPRVLIDRLQDIVEARSEELREKPYVEDLYRVKNDNLNLSLDFANYSADLYRRFFDWLVARRQSASGPSPQRILDLGSDNGIVTCFLAQLYPEAEVVGIDPCQTSVTCAQALAQKLNLDHVSFIRSTLVEAASSLRDRFDMVVSVRTFHEILGSPPEQKVWALNEIEVGPSEDDLQLRSLAELLRDEQSQFISWERLAYSMDYVWWVKKLQRAGLEVDWEASELIRFHEVGDVNKMPVFVMRKRPSLDVNAPDGLAAAGGASELSDTTAQTATQANGLGEVPAQVLKLSLKGQYYDPNAAEFDEDLAEYAFYKYPERELIFGFQVDYANDTGEMRLELWRAGDKALMYQYSTRGFRRLTVFSSDLIEALGEELQKSRERFRVSGNRVESYRSSTQRSAL